MAVMKLYLSSYHLGNQPEKLKELVKQNSTAAVILNAADNSESKGRSAYLKSQTDALTNMGIKSEELDLRKYFNKIEELKTKLTEYDMVWVVGGNSFVLLRAMKESGFNELIVPLVKNGSIVYAGFSAGAVVATPNLHGIELVDDKDTVPEGYSEEVVWEGLNLFSKSIAPHYRSNHPESESVEKVVQYFVVNGIDYVALADGQAVVVNGATTEVVG
jgi:dipeptidase E